jgi:cell pole-organizing protein PopZ
MSDTKSAQDLSLEEILTTVRRIIAEDEQPSAPAGGRGASVAPPDDVLELTEALGEDGSVRHLQPIGFASEPAGVPTAASPATDARAPTVDALPEASADAPAGSTDFSSTALLSEVAALAAATAFARLSEVPRPRHEPPILGGRPLDEVVRELLRPLLQTWLDENLPQIVERLVEAEIARALARAKPD